MQTLNPVGAEAELQVAAPAATLRGATVQFASPSGSPVTILDDLDLECRQGEFLVIVGRSGCGKTTVLNALAGLVDHQAGEVTVMGKRPRDARDRIGYMFARDALVPSRTARGNIEIGLEVRGVRRSERRARSAELMDKLGLSAAADRYPWQLSQGMRQRVALARTWALEPQLILMDEPFAALDAQTRESARAEFLGMWERGRNSVIFVTHDLTEALLLGDRVIIMGARGQIVEEFTLPFSRPRDPAQLPFTDEFHLLERRLHELLEHVDLPNP